MTLHFILFFFNDTATTEIYTLSLHDALPISNPHQLHDIAVILAVTHPAAALAAVKRIPDPAERAAARSEEHTSELQSHSDLVCRLLLEKKKTKLLSKSYSGCRQAVSSAFEPP